MHDNTGLTGRDEEVRRTREIETTAVTTSTAKTTSSATTVDVVSAAGARINFQLLVIGLAMAS